MRVVTYAMSSSPITSMHVSIAVGVLCVPVVITIACPHCPHVPDTIAHIRMTTVGVSVVHGASVATVRTIADRVRIVRMHARCVGPTVIRRAWYIVSHALMVMR